MKRKVGKIVGIILIVVLIIVAILGAVLAFFKFGDKEERKEADEHEIEQEQEHNIVILYTNDVHCGIEDNIGYAGLAAYKKQIEVSPICFFNL